MQRFKPCGALRARLRPGLRLPTALVVLAVAGCASQAPAGSTASASGLAAAGTTAAPLANAAGTPGIATPKSGVARVAAPSEVRTRNAVFKLANFDELPGWQQDDLRAGWGAFRQSCEVLQKRDEWREICEASRRVPAADAAAGTTAIRGFFESRFSLLRILNTDASREGDITGYFEPLLEGQRQRSAVYNVPVLGVPRDLYTIDWSQVPKAQRRSVVAVRPDGNRLVALPTPQAGSYALDLRRFALDDRDRRLRVRLAGSGSSARAEPYYTRAELEALNLPQDIGAPVIAWVNDGLALYAMQVQGSGRIRLPDGSILRVQYAEQNGHPFKPLRVAAVKGTKVVTRGTGAAAEQPQEFVLEDDVAADDDSPVVTRGKAVPAAGPRDGASDSLVDQLLGGAKPARGAAAAAAPSAKPPARVTQGRLLADPSYVFFKPVADRPASEGPQGALGVPLTAGRSVAVDPRVTPLGYPVFLSAPAPSGSTIQVQRLVFAQDTGGAIRGAVRADYFWGFGSEAAQNARGTKHRGQMWVLLPTAEAKRLSSSRIVTRGTAAAADSEEGQCLVADGEFCSEVE